MIWKDVIAGFLISGFVIVFVPPVGVEHPVHSGRRAPCNGRERDYGRRDCRSQFRRQYGNVPFAVALWGGGITFAGVIAFVYADLITIPVLNVYRKYYGWKIMLYIGVFFVTMAFTGFLMELLFDALGIVPDLAGGETATEQTYFELNYTFYLNIIAFGALRVPAVRLSSWSRCARPVPRSCLWDANRRQRAIGDARRRDVLLLLTDLQGDVRRGSRQIHHRASDGDGGPRPLIHPLFLRNWHTSQDDSPNQLVACVSAVFCLLSTCVVSLRRSLIAMST
jgi:hypothetical protein